MLHWLCPQDFLPPASDPQHFWVIRQEKTLALARALQVCAEVFGAKTGILCRAIRELQQCMAPLMTLNGDNGMEASLLRPAEEESEPSPHSRGRDCPPWQRRWALRSARLYPQTHGNPQVCRLLHLLHQLCPTVALPVKEKGMARDLCQPQQPWSVGPSLFGEG